jgi:hypothetical protein
MTDVVSNALGNLVSDGVSKGVKQLVTGNNPDDTQRINHDLQHAFRDALCLALYDIGGKGCFPTEWKTPRDVPDDVILWKTGNLSPNDVALLGAPSAPQQQCKCLWALGRAVKDERLFPFEPPLDETHLPSSVYFYLQARTAQTTTPAVQPNEHRYQYMATATPETLSDAFFAFVLDRPSHSRLVAKE